MKFGSIVPLIVLSGAGKANPAAQYDIGRQYRNGLGVQQNYRKAAIQGSAAGESGLGDMFAQGRGGSHDYANALYWYRKAAAQGNADAENGIGVLYAVDHNGFADCKAGGINDKVNGRANKFCSEKLPGLRNRE